MTELRVLVRYETLDRALRSASRFAAKHGPKCAIIRDEMGIPGFAYPHAVVTPYAYPYDRRHA